jgi:spore coat protein CotH
MLKFFAMKKTNLYIILVSSFLLASCDAIIFPSLSDNATNTSESSNSENQSSLVSNVTSSASTSSSTSTATSSSTSLATFDGCSVSSTAVISDQTQAGFETFFAPTTKVMIAMNLSQAQLKNVNDAGNERTRHDEYTLASVQISVTPLNSDTQTYCYPVVGVRMKGNTSRKNFVNEDGLIYDFVHYKISFASLSTNEVRVPNAPFFGMDKLDLKWNKNLDHTQIRQLYGYKMYSEYLPLSPEATLGGLTINQFDLANDNATTYMGLYTLIEPVDEAFLARRLPGAEALGNLYKVLYSATGPADFTLENSVNSDGTNHFRTGNKIGVENNKTNYHPTYDLKTNEKTPNFSQMVNLIGELNATNNFSNEAFKSRIEAVVDIDNFLLMEAFAYFFGNPDDLRNLFNNAYVYFLPSNNKAIFIPYDLDRGLGSNGDWDPTVNQGFTQFGPSTTKVSPFQESLFKDWNNGKMNPLHRFTIFNGGMPSYRTQYINHLRTAYESPWFQSTQNGNGQFSGFFYTMHFQYRATYYPQSGVFTYLQPSSPVLKDYFVPFSINSNAMANITFHAYLSGKVATYLSSVS